MDNYDSFFPDASAPPMPDVHMDGASSSSADPPATARPSTPTSLPHAMHAHPYLLSSHAASALAPISPPPSAHFYPLLDMPSDVPPTRLASDVPPTWLASEVPPTQLASSEGDPLREGELRLDVPQAQAIEVRNISSWWTRKFQIVVAHPRLRLRGLLLADLSNCTEAQAELVAQRLREDLADTIDGNRMSPTMYQNLVDQPKLRFAYIEAAQAVRPGPSTQTAEPSSSSSSAQASPAAPAAPAAARPTLAEETADTSHHECPICFDVINPVDAVLRCQSAPCHYFHRGCLRTWIQQCRDGNATCPICRQGLDIHGARLNDFLHGTASENLSEEERTFLQVLLGKIPGNHDQWSDMCTLENAQYFGGIVAAAGYGFFRGYNNVWGGSLGFYPLPRHVQIAEGVGFAAGAIARVVSEYNKNNDNHRGRHRRRRS
eukprot:GEMP01030771.1.p1 GENE.GEMP01030771.1~~GEMP01030771.1.p1  ORF type:complete len:433 (+),score=101.03 GEMP01030771.1:170-1468(+)